MTLTYSRIVKWDLLAKSATLADGTVLQKLDDGTMTKIRFALFQAAAIGRDGEPKFVDRPETLGLNMGASFAKRDAPSFASMHSRLHGNYLGTTNLGLAKGATPGQSDETNRLTKLHSVIHAETAARRERNRLVKIAVQKAAQSGYETEAGARRALKHELRKVGINPAELGFDRAV
jgi:hypothetical protein